ncbi:hypothetical protein [Gemmatimonas sp. UBA7669]|uniref:hypothetical protein n=1 Tax=Gemmatimonas sp. UBA7669 TaxID=1946568 RepID=UPI0025C65A4A|nr:hypothetical protein [Gemmatimonas sp. UBA7669]
MSRTRRLRFTTLGVTLGAMIAPLATPLSAQQADPAGTQPPRDVQYMRPQDKRGLNVFETSKEAGAPYTGFKLA